MRTLVYGAVATAALLFGFGSAEAQNVTLRISHQVPTGHHLHKMLEGFAADVKQRTNDSVTVQLFPAEQLHKAGENHAAVARGAVEGALSVNFQWGNTIPEMSVVVIPYFFSDLEKIKKFPTSEAAGILSKKLAEKGVHQLAWFYITRQAIFTSGKKPLLTLEDFKGVKIRGFGKPADFALESLGASTSAMPGPEVYNALQTGVLDAGLTDLSAAVSRRFYEVQKFATVTPALTVYFHLYVNPQWWGRLQPAQRQALEAAARKAEQDAITITEETAGRAVEELRAKGMTVKVHNAAEAAVWKDAMQKPVMDVVMKAPDGPKLIELINKL
jgi:TRAP-type C4-dicarboxylate transport system substrate-binding protein